MNQSNMQPPEQEFVDLEQYGQLLFDATPPAPPLSKHTKKAMLKNITGSSFAFSTKLFITVGASAMAAFVLVFGIAQTSQPGSVLYNLKIGADTAVTQPIPTSTSQTKEVIEKKQAELNTLKESGASTDDINKAESELQQLIESSKKESEQKAEDAKKETEQNSESSSTQEQEEENTEDHEENRQERRTRSQ